MTFLRAKHWSIAASLTVMGGLLPAAASAEFDRSYDGCFERAALNGEVTVLTKAPVCDFTLTNSGSATETEQVTVINVDPATTKIETTAGDSVDPTRGETELSFAVTLSAGQSASYTVSPLNYTGTESDFWFAAFGDPQNVYGTEVPNPAFVEIMEQINLVNPAFVLVAGDIIRGSTTSSEVQLTEYAEHDAVFQSFGGQVFPVPGDHDARQDPATHYSSFYGNRDYTYVYGNTRFIGLSTTETPETEGTLSEAQLAWLQTTLDNATEQHTIVYWHHPIVPPEWAGTTGIVGDEHRLEIAQMLVDAGVELLITGEAHGYDYRVIDGSNIPGLSGSFHQLVGGGGGGRMTGYTDTDHFFLLVHVTDAGIDHRLLDYSEFDLRLTTDQANDGSEAAVTVTLDNAGNATVPYVRPRFLLEARDKIYASRDDGQFLPFLSEEVDSLRRGVVETSIEPGQVRNLEASERIFAHRNITNQVHRRGLITFPTLPDPDDIETGLQVRLADYPVDIQVTEWESGTDQRSWVATTRKQAKTRYQVTDLLPNREYLVVRDGKPRRRIQADDEGLARFPIRSAARRQELELVLEPARVTDVGLLPGGNAGPNFRLLNQAGAPLSSFFVYDETLRHGYDSIWIDIDGDAKYELVTVPQAGKTSHLRLFESSGQEKAGLFPFGTDYTDGLELTAADLDGDGKEELVVAPAGNREPRVKVYSWRSGELEKIATFRAFTESATTGLQLASGDLNGDQDEELLVSRNDGSAVRVWRWKHPAEKLERWFGTRVLTGADSGTGASLTVGDLDFDGKDEVAVSTLRGSGQVQLWNFQAVSKNLRQKTTFIPFPAGSAQGLDLQAANLNQSGQEELLATPLAGSAQGSLAVLSFERGSGLLTLHSTSAVATGQPLSLTLADIDRDWKAEVIASPRSTGNLAQIWEYRRTGLKQTGTLTGYGAPYANGLSLTQHD